MLPDKDQYVNIHAHRRPEGSREWVLQSVKCGEYPPDPDPRGVYSVGIHPWEITEMDIPHALKKIRLATENSQVLAIGEIGLDSLAEALPDVQMKVFESQVKLAERAGLPVIIHAVKRFQELVAFSRSAGPSVPMIIHGFRGSLQLAEELLKYGYLLSFGAPLVDHEKVRSVFSELPLDRLFLETDESDVPIEAVYGAAAAMKGTTIETVRLQMVERVKEIFTRKR
jgi:TatD DNase family protein